MKIKNKVIVLWFFLAYSCTVYQHVPTPINVPVFEKKDQLQVNIGGDFKKGYLQMNYSISNAMYLYAESFYYKSKNSGWLDIISQKEGGQVDSYNSKNIQFKAGLGFYQNNDNLFFNFLVGSGLGNLDYEHGLDYGMNNINYKYMLQARNLELFIQPALGFKMDSYFDISFAIRIKQETYYHVWQKHEGDTNHYGESYDYLFSRPFNNFQFVEPGLTVRIGFKTVKLQLQGYRSFCLQRDPLKYKNTSANILIGITYSFGSKQTIGSLKQVE
jgi:hypothetical protein